MMANNKQCRIGSPPRMRGKALESKNIDPVVMDHPRACGEKKCISVLLIFGAGSPPRMRGKDRVVFKLFAQFGITPAHAGKSPALPLRFRPHWDHPRACGEKMDTSEPMRAE